MPAETAKQKKDRLAAEKAAAEANETVELVVTQAVLDAFPDMVNNEINIGDTVSMTRAEAAPFLKDEEEVEEKKDEKPSKESKGAMAVLKNGREYIRTYGADQKEELASFLAKDAAYTAVPDADVEALEVMYEVKSKDGTISRPSKRFTGNEKAEAILFRNEHRSNAIVAAAKK